MSLKTQGTEVFLLDATDSGNEVRKIGKLTGVPTISDGAVNEIDVTTLESTAREFLNGIAAGATFSLPVIYDPTDGSHSALLAAKGGDAVRIVVCGSEAVTDPSYTSEFTIPTDRTTWDFNAVILDFEFSGEIDDVWRASISVRTTGSLTVTEAV